MHLLVTRGAQCDQIELSVRSQMGAGANMVYLKLLPATARLDSANHPLQDLLTQFAICLSI
jgi:hypothetical protein